MQLATIEVGEMRHLLGYSFLVHRLAIKIHPNWWLQGGYQWFENHQDVKGEEITCAIFQEIQTIALQNNINEVYILIQYEHKEHLKPWVKPMIDSIKSRCIDHEHMVVIDLREILLEVQNRSQDEYDALFRGHMSFKGNTLVAEYIVRIMQQHREKP